MRVSIFVDGENVAAQHADAIWSIGRGIGTVDFARIYGNVQKLGAWQSVPGARVVHAGSGKNAADILLTVEAMERAMTAQSDAIVLVSSDGDFVHLATVLRERGLEVLGVGEAKTPERYRAACSRFECLGDGATDAPEDAAALTRLDRRILQVLADEGGPDRTMPLSQLGQRMKAKHDITTATLPARNWRAYLEARPHVFSLQIDGTSVQVAHLRQSGARAADSAA